MFSRVEQRVPISNANVRLYIRRQIYFNINEEKKLFSSSVVFKSLQPHGLHLARLLCPSPYPGAGIKVCYLASRKVFKASNHIVILTF